VERFEPVGFSPDYDIELDPEFPGNGEWGCPVMGFDRDGSVIEDFDSRWGPPLLIRVHPGAGAAWVAMFASGGLGSLRTVVPTPHPRRFVAVVGGLAYVVDASTPGDAALITRHIHQIVPSAEARLTLLVDYTSIVAVGSSGTAWATPGLCLDDLYVVQATPSQIVCTCDNLEGSDTLTLDPRNGRQTGGSRRAWPS
jgi:hypothetical protein